MVAFIAIASVLLAGAVVWAVLPLAQGALRATLVASLVIVTATALYWYYGAPESLFSPPAATDPATASIDQESVMQMIAGLQAKLEQSPGEADEWLMLGRSYAAIGRFDDALKTYQRAHAVLGDQPDLLADWAEVELHTQDNVFSLAINQRIQRVLAQHPEHPKALWLGGFAALQAGNKLLALERWRRLLAIQPPGSDSFRLIAELIDELSADPNR